MQASIEMSLYPLKESYKEIIKKFLEDIRKSNENLLIETNLMSTQIFGDYDEIMDLLRREIKPVLEKNKAVFVVKFLGTNLKEENKK
ncbi:MAG TPA: YkoF family thiamine/hydroxymethylpyrimidine-binding protein [Ignavibacteriaceae bacterium]|nr:YkoF family thiamine/hydroxymethylpyrimidine-binding protein [Ignavibacteriaceae bacterium]